jgi:hypothetical protein
VGQVCKCKRLTAANGGLDPAFSKGRHSTAFELRPSFAVPENFSGWQTAVLFYLDRAIGPKTKGEIV